MPKEYWKPKRKEIEEWKNQYIFKESYKIFFVTISIILQEWLANLVEFHKCWRDE